MGESLTLILGGARSGKSDYALSLVGRGHDKVLFVATATALDEEMQTRITAHRASRPAQWDTLEAPLQVGRAIRAATPADWILLDCMTLLVSNIMVENSDHPIGSDFRGKLDAELESLLDAYSMSQAKWVIVSNEVGLGLVPPYPLGRLFRDELGRINQVLAKKADVVYLMVAGIAMVVKGQPAEGGTNRE